MYEKTLGVALTSIPYNDRIRFLHVYTEQFGKVTYRVKTGTGRRHTAERLMQAPMTLLEMEVQHSPSQQIQTLGETRILQSPYQASMADPGKMAQCMFLAELLDKCVVEVEPNPELFDFIRRSIELMAATEGSDPNFHLAFVMRLCHLLGFQIDTTAYQPGMQFDIHEGIFTDQPIPHPYYLNAESSRYFHAALAADFADPSQLSINREQRNYWLDTLLLYLKAHLPEMGDIRSLDVLKELFS
jgi:DNA repair protein RecO (recombination protein O)